MSNATLHHHQQTRVAIGQQVESLLRRAGAADAHRLHLVGQEDVDFLEQPEEVVVLTAPLFAAVVLRVARDELHADRAQRFDPRELLLTLQTRARKVAAEVHRLRRVEADAQRLHHRGRVKPLVARVARQHRAVVGAREDDAARRRGVGQGDETEAELRLLCECFAVKFAELVVAHCAHEDRFAAAAAERSEVARRVCTRAARQKAYGAAGAVGAPHRQTLHAADLDVDEGVADERDLHRSVLNSVLFRAFAVARAAIFARRSLWRGVNRV